MIGDPVALRMRRTVERPAADLLDSFRDVPSSFVADAQQGMNCLDAAIRPLSPGMRFAGPAITANGGPRDNLAAMAALDTVREGDVLVLATGRDGSGAVVGDHYAAVAKGKGVAAIVTDGLVRDAEGIRKLGPPTFARGVRPNAGYRNGPGEVNMPVSLGGAVVLPGDIVVGDDDGVVVVPRANADGVREALARVIEAERAMEKKVADGKVGRLWNPDRYGDGGVLVID